MDSQTKTKYIYTAAHYYCFIACGLCFSIFNPTLIDLKDIFHTSLKSASLVFPIRSTGYVFGTLICGAISTIFNRQLVLIVLLILKSGTIALVPHWHTVYQFYINAVFNGFFTAGIDTTVNVWVNEMWANTNGGPYMQALHFFFGIGSILGPIISEPFLSPVNKNQTLFGFHNYYSYDWIQFSNNSSDNAFHSKLFIPYSISASTAVISAIIYLILYKYKRYESENPINQNSDTEELIEHNSDTIQAKFVCPDWATIWMISISGLFLIVYAGQETAFFQFSASFATQTDLHLSKNTGAYMASVLALSFTINRALSILIAIKISPQYIIYIDCLILISGNLIIYIFANNNETLLWFGIIILGIGYSSIFPSFYPFIKNNLRITDIIGSIFLFCAGLSSIVCPLVVGLFIETKPFVLIYLCFLSTILTMIILFILHITLKFRNRSIDNTENVSEINTIPEEILQTE